MKRVMSLASVIFMSVILSVVSPPRMISEASEGSISLAEIEICHIHAGNSSSRGGVLSGLV